METSNSGGSFLRVLIPILHHSQIDGILEASVDVTQLLQKSQSQRIQTPLNSWIVESDGSSVYTRNANESAYVNLYALIEGNPNSETTRQQVRALPAGRQFRYVPGSNTAGRDAVRIADPAEDRRLDAGKFHPG